MSDRKSATETIKEAALDNAYNTVVNTLIAQGVDRQRAAVWVDENVTFMFAAADRVFAESGNIRSQGWSNEALTHFARTLHLNHQGLLKGKPVPFGTEKFISDMDRQRDAQVTAARQEHSVARTKKLDEDRERSDRMRQTDAKQRVERHGPDVAGRF